MVKVNGGKTRLNDSQEEKNAINHAREICLLARVFAEGCFRDIAKVVFS